MPRRGGPGAAGKCDPHVPVALAAFLTVLEFRMVECDARLVEPVNRLLQAAPDHRDEKWRREFLNAVVNASFSCGNPQVFIGPDGFSYFGLHSPPADRSFHPYCICNLVEPLTEQGIGISINPHSARVDWVFTAGDLLAYRLHHTFEDPEGERAQRSKYDPAPLEPDKVLIGAPSTAYLPSYTRRILRRFIEERLGIPEPGVFLMRSASGSPLQHLVFSVYPERFSDEAAFRSAHNELTWFLPRHYSLVPVPKGMDWARYFQAL